MKKIIIAMAAIAAAFTMASCNKEPLVEPEVTPVAGNDIITAFTENNLTKTSLKGDDTEGYEVVWSEGDTFRVRDGIYVLIGGEGTSNGIFKGSFSGPAGMDYAYYPASYDGSNWPLAQKYAGSNSITGSPMTADVFCAQGQILGGKAEFKNVGGILRLSVKGTAKVTSIIVCTDNMPNITLDCGDGVDLDSTNGTMFHIAMPVGIFSGTQILFSTDNGKYCIKTLKSNLIINRSEITSASIKIDKWSNIISSPEGALSGSFTVSSDGTRVFFSKGNLYWDNSSFQFESSQLSSATEWNASHISHFYWSNDADKACADYYSDPDASKDDVFFTNATYTTPDPSFTANGQTDMWRTLSKDEWKYLIENSGSLWTNIAGVNGLIIFCDGYTGNRTGLTEIPEGCAFLPTAGSRNGYSSMISGVGSEGAYSSSVAGAAEGDPTPCAYDLVFGESYTTPHALNYRVRYGCSVRLVTEKSGKSVPTFTVTFDMNGKTGTAPASIDVPYHNTITTIPADPATEGYTFIKWCKDKACTIAWDFNRDVVTSNITLYAQWHISGILPSTFTVDDSGKQVCFSKGNLWSDDKGIFHFEDTQYDFNSSDYITSHVSHFMWSKNSDVARALQYDDPLESDTDVFFTNATQTTPNSNFTVNGQTGMWRTLSAEEWKYLIENNGIVWATINGVNGLIIFCDGYSGERGGVFREIPKGCLFLPAAGIRAGGIGERYVYNVGIYGYYWTSTLVDRRHEIDLFFCYFDINSTVETEVDQRYRYFADSVRLVTDVK